MPATSYSALYDFPGNVSAAAKAILVAEVTALLGSDTHADPDAFIFGPRENAEMPVDRIEVIATQFTQASDQQVKATANGEWFFAHYSGQLQFSVLTPRSIAVAASEHGARVGHIQFAMTPRARRFTSSNLPHYEICVIRLATEPAAMVDTDLDADRTDLTYNVELWISPDAFPETVP